MKKEYMKPSIEVMYFEIESSIIATSNKSVGIGDDMTDDEFFD